MTPVPRVFFRRTLIVVATGLLLVGCGGEPSAPSASPTRRPTQQASHPRRDASTKAQGRRAPAPGGATARRARRQTGSEDPDRDKGPPAGADVVRVTVRGDRVKGPDEVRAALGERVRIRVAADTSDHIHVHGYDVFADVAPGRPARLRFKADIPGAFEVELEDSHRPLLDLVVR